MDSLLASVPVLASDERPDRLPHRIASMVDALLDPREAFRSVHDQPDGSGLTKVTDNAVGGRSCAGTELDPRWRILFGKLANLGADEFLRIINADGTGEASATGNLWTKGEGKWRPGT
jgi:hypothetical protein